MLGVRGGRRDGDLERQHRDDDEQLTDEQQRRRGRRGCGRRGCGRRRWPCGIAVAFSGVAPGDTTSDRAVVWETPGFLAMMQAYRDYAPIRKVVASAPADPRTDGTHQLYFSQRWGANLVFISTDTRSYRDIRLKQLSGSTLVDDKGPRADHPDRTMLGETQLAWLKQSLLDAKAAGVFWKVVAVSSPIDEAASTSGNGAIPLDTGKTWIGGYRAERNELLKFVDDNDIHNVVFLTTDDHELRVNELTYFGGAGDPSGPRVLVPHALSIVAGPFGAFGPGLISDHGFENILGLAEGIVAQQAANGVDPLGLDPQFSGLQNVFRKDDPMADSLRQAVDFYSPDTFNYVVLDVGADGQTLAVNAYGTLPHPRDTFPDPASLPASERILGFELVAAPE